MITRKKQVDTKSITLQEVSSSIFNGERELAIIQCSEGFGVLSKVPRSDYLICITDSGFYNIPYDEVTEWLSNWEFVKYITHKDLEIRF